MKKVISITLVFIIAMFACIGAFAETGSSNMIDIDHVTVIFEEDSMFTREEQQYIAEMLVYGNENATTLGIGVCSDINMSKKMSPRLLIVSIRRIQGVYKNIS